VTALYCPGGPGRPAAIDVALDHIIWLRLAQPLLTPRQAGAAIGATVHTWAEAVQAFAAAWEALSEHDCE
jgi:hypothetical protein